MKPPDRWLDISVSTGVFLFFALMLSVPRGYTLGALILLLAGLYRCLRGSPVSLTREDKFIVWLFAAFFGVGVFGYFYHGNPSRSLDLISRYLMAIPILLLLIARPPNYKWVWSGLVVGCASAALVTVWQVHALEYERAMGSTGVIQFGNIGLMMGVFCIAGVIGLPKDTRSFRLHGRLALAVGGVSGVYVSMASGSRGGWIALPAIVLVFAFAYVSRRNIKYMLVVLVALVVAAGTVVSTVPVIEERIAIAYSDIERYRAGDPNTSLGYRFEMYKSLSLIIPKKPWLGWGYKDYEDEQHRLVETGQISDVIIKMANTHNTYLEVWVFNGATGLAVLLLLLFTALVYFGRRLRAGDPVRRVAAVCGASLILGYAISSFSQVMLNRNNTLLFFLISLTVLWAVVRLPGQRS